MSRVSRTVIHNGVTYNASREALARDGGSPPRMWYWTVQDPKLGACIDERVPNDYYSTLRGARRDLARFLNIKELP